jgi:hypothetical protein
MGGNSIIEGFRELGLAEIDRGLFGLSSHVIRI